MAKKKEQMTHAKAAEQQAEQRLAAICQFNANNMGEAHIDPDRIPTDEEIADAKKEFEDRTKALQDKKDYLIADAANSLRVAKFLKNFIENGFWTQRFFVGVINFSDFINKFIEETEKEPKDLMLDYGPMQFAYLMFENYAGFGLESAKKFAEMWDEYIPIHDTLKDHVEWYQNEVEEIKKLQQRWGMLSQGFYLTYETPKSIEIPEEALKEPKEKPEKEEASGK